MAKNEENWGRKQALLNKVIYDFRIVVVDKDQKAVRGCGEE